MATITVRYVVTLDADAEHTEDQKLEEIKELIVGQVDAVRRVYDEGITVTGTLKVTDTDEENL